MWCKLQFHIIRVELFFFVLTILLISPYEARKGKSSGEAVQQQERENSLLITENPTEYPLTQQTISPSSVLKFGSFNLKQFGKKKSKDEQLLKILAKIVIRYDLIALQEITDVKEDSIKKLMGAINDESSFPYHYVVSPRVGRTKQKEQYGLIFRPDIFKVKRSIVFEDSSIGDPFSREPQIAEILVKKNGETLVIINVHVAPKNASSEIDSLTDVHTWVEDKWRLPNIVLLGDLNADCDYIRKKDIPNIRLLNNPTKYNWLISNSVDTTVGNTNCAYDRIIISGPYLTRNVVPDSAKVFEFDREYGLEQKAALNVSDHYPVEFSLYLGADNSQASKIQSSSDKTVVTLNYFKVYGGALVLCNLFSKLIIT